MPGTRGEVMRQPIRLGITAVASPLEVGAKDASAVLDRLTAAFAAAYGDRVEVITAGPAMDPASSAAAGRAFYDQRVDAICVVAVSWFEDYLVLDLLEECDAPLVAWARPGMETGALCGMQQLAFMLKNLSKNCVVLFGEPGDPINLARAWDFVSAAALRRKLRRTTIGHLGHRVEGMTETTAHELALKKLFGPRVVGLDTRIFLDRAARADAALAAEAWRAVKGQVGSVTATDEAGVTAMQVYVALRDTLREQNLTAAAVGCYPHLMGKVCLGISLLAEEGIPVACEGDVNNAVSMVMLAELTGRSGPQHRPTRSHPGRERYCLLPLRQRRLLTGAVSRSNRPGARTPDGQRRRRTFPCPTWPGHPGEPRGHAFRLQTGNAFRRSDRYRHDLPRQPPPRPL